MKNIIYEATAADLSQKIKTFGYVDAGKMTSAGPLNSDFVDILIEFATEWYNKKGKSCPIRFGAGNDTWHKAHTPNSRHLKGAAIDITIDLGCHKEFIELLIVENNEYHGFWYLDEYRRPSKKATGPHFHLSYIKNNPEGSASKSNQSLNTVTRDADSNTASTTNTSTAPSDDDALSLGFLMPVIKKVGEYGPKSESVNEEIKRIKELMV